jgi:D-alanyl-D-alanine carboxypeptidase
MKLLKEDLLFLSLISFVFVSSFALALDNPEIVQKYIQKKSVYAPLPVLAQTNTFPIFSAQGVIAVDLDSGVVLYEKNADAKLLPASTTKIMTALVALDSYTPETVLRVGRVKVDGQKMGLVMGEEISVRALLDGLLIYSANDAAEALAENYPGGREAFVAAMNAKAQALHLDHTSFFNPTGLDGNAHVSTARDMVRLSEFAMRNPTFTEIVATKEKVVTDQSGRIVHRLRNLNELLGKDGVVGVKTGWTENARENLVTFVNRDNHRVLIALLGSQDRFGETEELINWLFANYLWQEVAYP